MRKISMEEVARALRPLQAADAADPHFLRDRTRRAEAHAKQADRDREAAYTDLAEVYEGLVEAMQLVSGQPGLLPFFGKIADVIDRCAERAEVSLPELRDWRPDDWKSGSPRRDDKNQTDREETR